MIQTRDGKDMVFAFLPAGNFLDVQFTKSLTHALGPAYIIAYLRQHGLDVAQIVSSKPLNIAECVRLILEKKPKVIGFTVYFTNYNSSVFLAKALKELDPNLIIVFGGPTPTVQSETILESIDFVDICVRNQGEETMLELLTNLQGENYRLETTLLSKIAGISYKVGDRVFRNIDRNVFFENKRVTECLDKYPSPYLTGILDDYEAGILTARGCNQNCTFCNCAVLSKRSVLTHSIDRVVEELERVSRMNVSPENPVFIFDDAFTLIPNRAVKICQKIIENKLHLSLRCITRCDKVDRDLLDLMKEAGFCSIGFSLESATPHVLRNIGKLQPPSTKRDPSFEKEKSFIEQFKENIKYAQELGMFTFASIMIGLPGETRTEGQQTIDLIESVELPLYTHNILEIYPGTPLASDHQRYGIETKLAPNGIEYITKHTYNPYSLHLAQNSSIERTSRAEQKFDVKLLSLISREEPSGDYCNNLIYVGDHWRNELTLWLQENLSINGRIIQISNNAENLENRIDNAINGLGEFRRRGLLTTAYTFYKMELTEDGIPCIRSFLYFMWKEKCDYPILLINSNIGLSMNESHSVYFEDDEADALFVVNLLRKLSSNEKFSSISELPPLPYFATLCKWDVQVPNCMSLETLIVDSELNIKTCWQGQAIGKIGMPYSELRGYTKKIREDLIKNRGCIDCSQKTTCVQCLFPDPLEEKTYCELKCDPGIEEAARKVRNLHTIQELIM